MKSLLFIVLMTLSSFMSSPVFAQEDGPVFDINEWADVRLAQVYFRDNPKNDKAFLIYPPAGWIRVKDVTRPFTESYMKTLSPEKRLFSFQNMYPYIVLAKALDSWSWNKEPYQYRTPKELLDYSVEFMMLQFSLYQGWKREEHSNQEIYQKLVEEIGDQEFSLKISWPWCEEQYQSIKRYCASLNMKIGSKELRETLFSFATMPATYDQMLQVMQENVENWYATNRRISAFMEVLALAQNAVRGQINSKTKNEVAEALIEKKFYEILWNKVAVFTYADYCDFNTLICNKFDRKKFSLPLTNEVLSVVFSSKLNEND